MASIDVGIHPDPAGITTKCFPGGPPASFSTLEIWCRESHVAVFVNSRAVLEALQAALREIENDMGRAEQAAMKAAQTASDQVPTVMADWPAGPPGEALGVFGK
jgi:hypothetical protein